MQRKIVFNNIDDILAAVVNWKDLSSGDEDDVWEPDNTLKPFKDKIKIDETGSEVGEDAENLEILKNKEQV